LVFVAIMSSLTALHLVGVKHKGGFEENSDPLRAHSLDQWTEYYPSPDRMPIGLESLGPWLANPTIGGLYMFKNVCVTNNIDAPKPPE